MRAFAAFSTPRLPQGVFQILGETFLGAHNLELYWCVVSPYSALSRFSSLGDACGGGRRTGVLHARKRVGRNGITFRCPKFRTVSVSLLRQEFSGTNSQTRHSVLLLLPEETSRSCLGGP